MCFGVHHPPAMRSPTSFAVLLCEWLRLLWLCPGMVCVWPIAENRLPPVTVDKAAVAPGLLAGSYSGAMVMGLRTSATIRSLGAQFLLCGLLEDQAECDSLLPATGVLLWQQRLLLGLVVGSLSGQRSDGWGPLPCAAGT